MHSSVALDSDLRGGRCLSHVGREGTVNSEKVDGPFFNGPNTFAVHYVFDVTPKSTGKPIRIEEVGVYTVENDQITREQFFYDGKR